MYTFLLIYSVKMYHKRKWKVRKIQWPRKLLRDEQDCPSAFRALQMTHPVYTCSSRDYYAKIISFISGMLLLVLLAAFSSFMKQQL